MKQITEDYVSYEIAKLLKEKGFDELCNYEWWITDIDKGYVLQANGQIKNSNLLDEAYTAPTHQMALKWLREVHTICIEVCRNINTFYYSYRVIQGASFVKLLDWSNSYDTYEEAVEAALLYVLKNLI